MKDGEKQLKVERAKCLRKIKQKLKNEELVIKGWAAFKDSLRELIDNSGSEFACISAWQDARMKIWRRTRRLDKSFKVKEQRGKPRTTKNSNKS